MYPRLFSALLYFTLLCNAVSPSYAQSNTTTSVISVDTPSSSARTTAESLPSQTENTQSSSIPPSSTSFSTTSNGPSVNPIISSVINSISLNTGRTSSSPQTDRISSQTISNARSSVVSPRTSESVPSTSTSVTTNPTATAPAKNNQETTISPFVWVVSAILIVACVLLLTLALGQSIYKCCGKKRPVSLNEFSSVSAGKSNTAVPKLFSTNQQPSTVPDSADASMIQHKDSVKNVSGSVCSGTNQPMQELSSSLIPVNYVHNSVALNSAGNDYFSYIPYSNPQMQQSFSTYSHTGNGDHEIFMDSSVIYDHQHYQ
jgi:hypothetical protein